MNELVEVVNNQVVVSSVQVAKAIEKRHDHVMRDIRTLQNSLNNFEELFLSSTEPDCYSRNREIYLITKSGCYMLLNSMRYYTKGKKSFIKFIQNVFKEKINTVLISPRLEDKFIINLRDALIPFGYSIVSQLKVGKYRVDGFITRLNIAIEFDEEHHYTQINSNKDKIRQKYIENKLGCTFIRCSYKNSVAYNIGLVLKTCSGNL